MVVNVQIVGIWFQWLSQHIYRELDDLRFFKRTWTNQGAATAWFLRSDSLTQNLWPTYCKANYIFYSGGGMIDIWMGMDVG